MVTPKLFPLCYMKSMVNDTSISRAEYETTKVLSGHFVRLAPREVSVSHPDAIKAILLAPIRKVDANTRSSFPS